MVATGERLPSRIHFPWLEPARVPGVALPTAVLDASTSVADARLAFVDYRGSIAVVVEHGRPIGLVTAAALRGDVRHVVPAGATVGDVMDFEVVHIDPVADAHDTLAAYSNAAWASLRRRRPLHVETAGRRSASPEQAQKIA
jgi:hypothetical protein